MSESKAPHRTLELEKLPDGENQTFFARLGIQIQRKREAISKAIKPNDPWGMFRALLLRERVSGSPLTFLSLLGFLHLASASGLHLLALAAMIRLGLGRLFVLCGARPKSALFFQWSLNLGLCLWVWLLSGGDFFLFRALLLFGARSLSKRLGFRWKRGFPILLTLLIDLWISWIQDVPLGSRENIYALLSLLGFYLAFDGWSDGLNEKWSLRRLAQSIFTSWLLVAIAKIAFLEPVSLASLVFGMTLAPVFCLTLYPALVLGSFLPFLEGLSAHLTQIWQRLLEFLTAKTLAVPELWMISWSSFALGVFFSLLLAILSARLSKTSQRFFLALSLALLIGLRVFIESQPAAHEPYARLVSQLDVGQGDSALVLSSDSSGLLDAGSASALSDSQWIRLFSHYQVSRLDWVMLTHLDQDHRGGLDHLIRLMPIRCVVSSENEFESERGKKLAQRLRDHGVQVVETHGADLSFELPSGRCAPYPIWSPESRSSGHQKANQNMSALLVPLSSGRVYLSAGDADANDEPAIFGWADHLARAFAHRVLKVSHHGSRTSSNEKALKIFHPELGVISVGLGNSYGHPSREVLERFSRLAIPIHRTDRDGPKLIE